jgi:hypothetical protein
MTSINILLAYRIYWFHIEGFEVPSGEIRQANNYEPGDLFYWSHTVDYDYIAGRARSIKRYMRELNDGKTTK